MRNKHDGAGYRRVAVLENSVDVFCGWCLIVQVASRMPTRGVLCDSDGPLDAADLAAKTGYPERVFKAAFEALIHPKIQWLEVEAATSTLPLDPPSATSTLPETYPLPGKKGVEGKGTEVATTTSVSTTPALNGAGRGFPSLEEAKRYADGQSQRLIRPEWVDKWWLDRNRKGWTYDTRSGNQVPITDWRSDLQFYAQSWQEKDDKAAAKEREKAAKVNGKKQSTEPTGDPVTQHELPPAEVENIFPAMFAANAERRKKHEEWLATPHGADEQSPYL